MYKAVETALSTQNGGQFPAFTNYLIGKKMQLDVGNEPYLSQQLHGD